MSQIYQNLPPTNGKVRSAPVADFLLRVLVRAPRSAPRPLSPNVQNPGRQRRCRGWCVQSRGADKNRARVEQVILTTTMGDIDVELWPKEAPLACRNFIQLCLEGYYDNTMFHRIIAKFMVQGGDPSGTGQGGESVWGETFKDEIHSRLRFGVRGLLAMANGGKDDNGSQFFLTLGQCEWLNGKHTIFGKVTGNTIYNLDAMGACEVDGDDRPLYPPRMVSTEVIHNPFDDIAPRDLHAMRKADEERKPKVKGKKDKKLLSFAEDEEAAEEAPDVPIIKKKMVSAHDALDDDRLVKMSAEERSLDDKRRDEELARREAGIRDSDGDSADDQDDSDDEKLSGAKKRQAEFLQIKESKLRKLEAQAESDDDGNTAEQERQQRKREMEQLKREIMGMRKGARVKVGADSVGADNRDVELLTEHQKKVAVIKRGRKLDGTRQMETLEKLKAFQVAAKGLVSDAAHVAGAVEGAGEAEGGAEEKKDKKDKKDKKEKKDKKDKKEKKDKKDKKNVEQDRRGDAGSAALQTTTEVGTYGWQETLDDYDDSDWRGGGLSFEKDSKVGFLQREMENDDSLATYDPLRDKRPKDQINALDPLGLNKREYRPQAEREAGGHRAGGARDREGAGGRGRDRSRSRERVGRDRDRDHRNYRDRDRDYRENDRSRSRERGSGGRRHDRRSRSRERGR